MLRTDLFGWIGIAAGGTALLLLVVHFYAGPFSPPPTLESLIAGKALAIKESLLASVLGSKIPDTVTQSHYDLDRIAIIAVAVLAASAVILGAIGEVCKGNRQAASVAIMLGAGTLYFQFAFLTLGVIAVILLIAVVLSFISGLFTFG